MGLFSSKYTPIRRRNHGIVKVLILGDKQTGKSTLLRSLARLELQPLKTWEPRQDSGTVTIIQHKEDRAQTYIEEMEGRPFPAMALSGCDTAIICFSLVDRRTWASAQQYFLGNIMAEIAKNQGYRPMILVGTKSDVRDQITKEKEALEKSGALAEQPDFWGLVPESLKTPPADDARCTVQSLPLDALLRVFDYLPTPDLVSASRVCSSWAQVVRHPYNWTQRAKGTVSTSEVMTYLQGSELKPFNIKYTEVQLTSHDVPKQGDRLFRPKPVQDLLYTLVNTAATFSRSLPESVVRYYATKKQEKEATPEKTDSSPEKQEKEVTPEKAESPSEKQDAQPEKPSDNPPIPSSSSSP